MGERGDHQAVPVGEHLVVPAGSDAAVAAREQFFAQGGEPAFLIVRMQIERIETIENDVAFPIAFAGDVVDGVEEGGIGLANLRKRLELLYPSRHSLRIDDQQERFSVFMEINLANA